MRGLRAMNFAGINLTIPHKINIMRYLDEIAPDAALIGAVNTVRRVVPSLIEDGSYADPWIGIQGLSIDPLVAEQLNLPARVQILLIL